MNTGKVVINWQNFARVRLQSKFAFIIRSVEAMQLCYRKHFSRKVKEQKYKNFNKALGSLTFFILLTFYLTILFAFIICH